MLLNFFPPCLVPSGNLTGHRTQLGLLKKTGGRKLFGVDSGEGSPLSYLQALRFYLRGLQGQEISEVVRFQSGQKLKEVRWGEAKEVGEFGGGEG